MEILLFYSVALVAVLSGFLVIRCQSPVNSALGLVNTFFCLAIFYVMLHAPFMAAMEIYRNDLASIGVSMHIDGIEWAIMTERMEEKDFDAYTGGWVMG